MAAQPSTSTRLKIGLLYRSADHADYERGFRLGVAEAGRTARLLRGSFESAAGASLASLSRAGCAIVVGAAVDPGESARFQREASERGVLYVNAACDADSLRSERCGALAFHVAPSRSLRAAAAPRSAGVQVVAWDARLSRYGAEQLSDRYRHTFGRDMSEQAWCAWMSVKVGWEAALRARSSSPPAITRVLLQPATGFDGHKGRALRFDPRDRQLYQPLYVLPDLREMLPPAEPLAGHGRGGCGR